MQAIVTGNEVLMRLSGLVTCAAYMLHCQELVLSISLVPTSSQNGYSGTGQYSDHPL